VTFEPPDAPRFALSRVPGTGGSVTLTIVGEIDAATSPQLRQELSDLIEGGTEHIELDLSAMTFIDSTGLGVLVGALKRMHDERDGRLPITGVSDPVRRVFEITGLTGVFDIPD
jgi:anti-sigma B factor antagonist